MSETDQPADESGRAPARTDPQSSSTVSPAAPRPVTVGEVAEYLLRATARSTIFEITFGMAPGVNGRAAIRGRLNARQPGQHGFAISDWEEYSPKDAGWVTSATNAVVVCVGAPEKSLTKGAATMLRACMDHNAIVLTAITSAPSQGDEFSSGDPFLENRVRLLTEHGLSPIYAGYAYDGDPNQGGRTIITIHDPSISSFSDRPKGFLRPLAILSAFNEADIIADVVHDLLEQGCDLAIVDNWSTDGTWEIVEQLRRDNADRIQCERFPESGAAAHYEWAKILGRKEEIAAAHPGRWIIHTDADETRQSPFDGTTLAEGLQIAEAAGANRVHFNLINFRPVDRQPYFPGTLSSSFKYFEFGARPGHFVQAKAWLQGNEKVSLASSGGHMAKFSGIRDFPYRFLLKHYPIRSAQHGTRKVFIERKPRWSPAERTGLGWHTQYDNLREDEPFLWRREMLQCFDDQFWPNYGLLVMTDILQRRLA